MSLAGAPADRRSPLRENRDFRLLWGGAGLSVLGSRATAIAYPLVVLWFTGSSQSAGLVGFALFLPLLLVQLPGGALVDRWDRRRLMLYSSAGSALVGAGVAVALLTDTFWLPHLLASAFVEGSLTAMYQLAERAAVPTLVTEQQIPAALVSNEARTRGAALLGQPLGSGLAGMSGGLPFALGFLMHTGSLLCLVRARGPFRAPVDVPRRSIAAEVAEGLVWLWRQRFLRVVIVAVAVSNMLFQGLNLAVMSMMHNDGQSALTIGLVTTLSGAGGLLGSLRADWWIRSFSMRALAVGALVAWTVLMVPLSSLHHVVVLGALFAGSGYVGGVFNVAAGVLLARTAPLHMQGRANSVVSLVASGAMSAGPLTAGFLLEPLGSARTILVFSAVMAATALFTSVSRGIRAGAPVADLS
ncbi:MFS transporter [Streptomyces sp. NPDC050549]|uniref:MFS transporter n=1 Tax=Streptomyces sp. NPDC050549 TaxID=3155406 RepID=UPI00342CD73E